MAAPQPQQDIDDLLDQVEQKYFHSVESQQLSTVLPKDCECNVKGPENRTDWDEVDVLLREIASEDTNPFGKTKNKSWARHELPKTDQEEAEQRCHRIYLAGSYEPMGHCSIASEKACDRLKCIRCDFNVVYFDNYTWTSSTDYLFLRNNMPDFDKLACNLQKRKGIRAYACQCQHISIENFTNVQSLPQIRWICSKHFFQ